MRHALVLFLGLGLTLTAQSPFAVKTVQPAGAKKAAALVRVNGKVTEWTGGGVGRSPKEKALHLATVVIGKDLNFQTGNSGMDTVKGEVLAKVVTNTSGEWKADLPAGAYTVIYWKAGYTPSINNPLTAPGTCTGTISVDKQMQGLHRTLRVSK